jgi:hypothetical protein
MQSTQFGAPSWKCTHGNYSPYCSSCRGADNGFRTYAECCKIKPIVEFAYKKGFRNRRHRHHRHREVTAA